MSEQERVLFIHAHPDDETIATGGTIATLVDRGAYVTVVTCTRGESGEVIPDDLQHLLASGEALADHRERELSFAMGVLGVADHRFLGEAGSRWPGREPRRYVDSGMAWGPHGAIAADTVHADSFTAADFGEIAADIAAVITDVRPSVIVSYNEGGGYGHPDHVRAHQAARRAADVYGIPFYVVEPQDSAAAADATVAIDVSPVLDRKKAAMEAHRTQIIVTGDRFALSNNVWAPIDDVESFRRLHQEFEEHEPFRLKTRAGKTVAAVAGLALGLCVGAILTVAHQSAVTLAGITIPIGLIIGVVIITALLVGLRSVFGSRVIAATTALGILSSVAVLSLRSAGGSTLVPATFAGYVWTFAPTVIGIIVLGWPRLPSRSQGRIATSPEVKGSLPQ